MIVVTGSNGFIGSNLIKGLNHVGINNIIAVDDHSNPDTVPNIAYSVLFINGQGQIGIPRGQRNYWTSIDITSEAHGWCNPSG